ncbi:hypothetical protein Droror1_Dr00027282 [Drosera rotundifolia]
MRCKANNPVIELVNILQRPAVGQPPQETVEQQNMTGVEDMSGPAGPKLIRLISFVGAGFVCAFAINKWRDYERRSFQRKNQLPQTPAMTTNEIHGAVE